jgi:DNA-binding winged helix-turn-helix (wHTH) protein/TolB-like protein
MQEKRLFDFAQFRFDAENQRLLHKNKTISLPSKAAELLLLMLDNQGRVLEKDFLMETLWQGTFVEEANLTQNIYLLRKALGKTSSGEAMIKTLPKRGYKFVPEVRVVTAEADALIVSKFTSIRARVVEEEIEGEQDEQIAPQQELLPATIAPLVLPETSQKRRLGSKIQIFIACGLILLLGAGIYFGLANQSSTNAFNTPIKSIAVMPLKTIGSGDIDEQFLGLGMADAIINRLGKTGRISVSPTDAVRRYDEKEWSAVDAGRALNAEAVLTGNIQRDGERTRVTVQLIRVADNQSLWSDSFDDQNQSIFALQDSISQRLAGALTLRLSGSEQENLKKKQTENVETYELY